MASTASNRPPSILANSDGSRLQRGAWVHHSSRELRAIKDGRSRPDRYSRVPSPPSSPPPPYSWTDEHHPRRSGVPDDNATRRHRSSEQRQQSSGRGRTAGPSRNRSRRHMRPNIIVLTLMLAVGLLYVVGSAVNKKRKGRPQRHSPIRSSPSVRRETAHGATSVDSWEQSSSGEDSDDDSDIDFTPFAAARHSPRIASKDRPYASRAICEEPVITSSARSSPRGKGKGRAVPVSSQSPYVLPAIDIAPETITIPQPARGEGCYGSDRECSVCSEDLPASEFLQCITAKCNHEVTTCRSCLGQWIQTSLQSRTWNDIKCAECKEMCRYADLIRIAPLDVVDA
jgi:hypothetical protein